MKTTNGKVLEYLFYLEKQGRVYATRRLASSCLRTLETLGAPLADPISVKNLARNRRSYSSVT